MSKPTKVQRVHRAVIENKVLDAITREGKVAILATESDLNLFIRGLELLKEHTVSGATRFQARQYIQDLQKLKKGAFG